MNLYLDDNFADQTLAGQLRKAGHTVVRPADAGLLGVSDARHLAYAIQHRLVLLTKDRVDFRDLHELLEAAGGKHTGILLAAYDNHKAKDMKTKHVVAAVGNLEQSGTPIAGQLIVLNQWR